mmetsp:Transcript_17528/g.20670  ORF Transcript_17528/g.20670 Transcript_17528/m.20670 type:complete len:111 (-) Transcript_17528:103-435(-)
MVDTAKHKTKPVEDSQAFISASIFHISTAASQQRPTALGSWIHAAIKFHKRYPLSTHPSLTTTISSHPSSSSLLNHHAETMDNRKRMSSVILVLVLAIIAKTTNDSVSRK